MRAFFQRFEQRLKTLLKVTAIFGTGQQRPQVQRVDHCFGKRIRHFAVNDTLGEPLGDGRLADTCLTNQQRVILAATHENLRNALDFRGTPNQRIDPALARHLIQIAGVGLQRIAGGSALCSFFIHGLLLVTELLGITLNLGNAVRDEVDDVDTRNLLLLEEKHSLTFLLAENRDQNICSAHLALAGALYVEYRALQHALKAQRWLGLTLLILLRDQRRGGVNKFG